VVGNSVDAEPIRGLNLTRATLRAILKYPWHYNDPAAEDSNRKWGAYRSESREMEEALKGAEPRKRSLEAQIMDWADDVTYAVHDLEDFFRTGLIPLHEFARAVATTSQAGRPPSPRSDPREEFLEYVHSVKPKWDEAATKVAFDRVAGFFPSTPYEDSPYDRGNLHGFASALISLFIPAFELRLDGAEPDPDSKLTVDLLKQLTWYYVINRPSLAAVQTGQREVIRSLFTRLKAAADVAERSLQETMRLPARLRYQITLAQKDREDLQSVNGNLSVLRARVVADFIANLTETQAYALHGLLSGDPGSAANLPRWLGP
jgi:dGTPase